MATQAQSEIDINVSASTPAPSSPPIGELPRSSPKQRRKLARRTHRDYSQITRRSFQVAFLLLNVWIGGIFYFWVRQFEPGGAATFFERPAGVEGWLPIAGLMNLRYFVLSHRVPEIHPAAMFLLIAFLGMAFLFRKAFCSWLCPVGTISEYLWRAGLRIFRRNFHLPRWLDLVLRSLKYLLLGFFVWAVASMATDEVSAFMNSPYGIIADVRMLNFFRHIGETAAIVLGVLAVASLFIQNFWCRYLCPYGALVGIVSLASPARVRRNAETCIDCAKCAKACPSVLPVDKLITIKSAECTGCLECVAVCPAQDALSLTLPRILGQKGQGVGLPGFRSGRWPLELPRSSSESLDSPRPRAIGPRPSRLAFMSSLFLRWTGSRAKQSPIGQTNLTKTRWLTSPKTARRFRKPAEGC